MEYDTDHIRFGGESKVTISGVSTFTNLIENTDLARLYAILRKSPMTAPALVEMAGVSKKTVYSYLSDLERAGLASKTSGESTASTYRAEYFEMTLKLRGIEVSITPELVDIFGWADDYPVIERVIDDHGVIPLVLAYDLVQGHNEGEVTVRQIAHLTGLSLGTTYDLVEALYEILDLEDDDHGATTFTPDDVDRDDDLVDTLVDN